jgi:hypothetical protein
MGSIVSRFILIGFDGATINPRCRGFDQNPQIVSVFGKIEAHPVGLVKKYYLISNISHHFGETGERLSE